MQFLKLCLKIITLAVLLLTFCVLRRCCWTATLGWLSKWWKFYRVYQFFLCLDISYLSLQNLGDSGMISLLQLYPKLQFTYLLTYLLTPWSKVVPEKLKGSHLVKKFLAFYRTRKFITAFTSTRHLSLSRATSIQSMPQNPTSWRSILILSSHLRLVLPSGLFPQVSPPKPVMHLLSPHTCYMPRPSHSSWFYHPNNIG